VTAAHHCDGSIPDAVFRQSTLRSVFLSGCASLDKKQTHGKAPKKKVAEL
jgi:hypothetical protein